MIKRLFLFGILISLIINTGTQIGFATGTKSIQRGADVIISWTVTGSSNCNAFITPVSASQNFPTASDTWTNPTKPSSGSNVNLGKAVNVGTWTYNCNVPGYSCSPSSTCDYATLIVADCTSPQVWDSTSKSCVTPTGTALTASISQSTSSTAPGVQFTMSWGSTGGATSCGVTYTGPDGGGTLVASPGATSGGPMALSPSPVGTYVITNTCTNGSTSDSASVTHTVAAPSATDCAQTPKTWLTNCSATLPLTSSGTSKTVSYSGSSYTGSATYTCSNTVWSAPTSATCTATAPTSQPDLVAGAITPTTGNVGVAIPLSSTIKNQGDASTGSGFTNLFQLATSTDSKGNGVSPVTIGTYVRSTSVSSNNSFSATLSYTPSSTGTKYIRACADKSSASDTNGSISESTESNNCGSWTTVTIGSAPSQPDLTAGDVSQTTATAETAKTFSATITNQGNASTGTSFYNMLQISTLANGGGTVTDIASSSMTTLAASGTSTISKSYAFASPGTFYMRACADKSSSGNSGTIAESNESNNCGNWVAITVASAAQASCSALPTQTWLSSCSAPVPAASSSATSVVNNTASGYTGSATWTCTNGSWSGPTSTSCTATNAACSLPWGGTIPHGSSTAAYLASTVTSPNTCTSGGNSETRICNNGALSGSYTNQSCAVYTPPAATVSTFNLSPRTVEKGGLVKINWSIQNPTASCKISAAVQIPTSCDATCQAQRAAASTTVNTTLTSGTTNANDPNGGSRNMTTAVTTAVSGGYAKGEKSINLDYSTTFTLTCGATANTVKGLIYVTEKTEG